MFFAVTYSSPRHKEYIFAIPLQEWLLVSTTVLHYKLRATVISLRFLSLSGAVSLQILIYPSPLPYSSFLLVAGV